MLENREWYEFIEIDKHPAENELPDIPQYQPANEIGNEETSPEILLTFYTIRKKIGEKESQDICRGNRYQRVFDGIQHRFPERNVSKHGEIVLQTYKIDFARIPVPIGKREINTIDEG